MDARAQGANKITILDWEKNKNEQDEERKREKQKNMVQFTAIFRNLDIKGGERMSVLDDIAENFRKQITRGLLIVQCGVVETR